jgi:hypothetical protein
MEAAIPSKQCSLKSSFENNYGAVRGQSIQFFVSKTLNGREQGH